MAIDRMADARRVAVIGAGRMGRRHIQMVMEAGFDLVGICDRSEEALRLAQTEHEVPAERQYRDVAELLEATRPEIVIVATTAPTHTRFTELAAEARARFVLCEKPMATSLADCERMRAVCRRHETRLAINHPMRFMEQYSAPRRLLESEAFGGFRSATVVAGNFGLAMNGTHYVEAFRYVAGEPPVEATAWFSETRQANPRGPEFEDRAGAIRLTTASGHRLYLDASEDLGHGLTAVYAGRYGQVTVDELAGELAWIVRRPEHRALPTTRYAMPWERGNMTIAPADVMAPSRAVMNALLHGHDYPTGEDGQIAVASLVAAHLSAEQGGRPVVIDDTLPQDRAFPWA
jgi:predicted dehydrogenase